MAQPRGFNNPHAASHTTIYQHITRDDHVPSSHHDQPPPAISAGESPLRNAEHGSTRPPNTSHRGNLPSVRQLPNGYRTWSSLKAGGSQNQGSFNPYYNSLSKQRFPSSRIHNSGGSISASSATGSEPLYPASDNSSGLVRLTSTKERQQMVKPSSRPSSPIEDVDDDLYEGQVQAVRRLSGACRHCKKLKTKCDFIVEFNMCRRCKTKGQVCIFEGRKKTEHKHEVLIAQLRDKEATIDTLLKEIKSRGVVEASRSTELPPNREMQNWIEELCKRFPPDPNNNWNEPSDKIEWRRKRVFRRNDPTGSNRTDDIRSQTDTTDDEDIEEGLPPLHPILKHHIPSIPAPIGCIADMHMRQIRIMPELYDSTTEDELVDERNDDDEDVCGIADPDYFYPGPAIDIDQRRFHIEREPLPDMLLHGLITMDDVDELFKIYFQRLNASVSLLDPVLHTPSSTFNRCPFLFTVICACASRYYPPKRAIYKYAMHLARSMAGAYLVIGWKTVELCQAYMLLSTFSIPAKKWEEDRTWMYLELAIRIALDLNLHEPLPQESLTTEKYERESLNRTRVWLNCYNLDCSMSTLLGRTPMINEYFVVDNAAGWYHRSPYNHSYDVHLCAYAETMGFMRRFHEAIRGDNDVKKDLDFYKRITIKFDDLLEDIHARIAARYDRDSDKNGNVSRLYKAAAVILFTGVSPPDPGCVFRTGLLPLLINYYRLVMFSFGFQQAVDQGLQKDDIFFQKCFDAACGVITTMIDILAPTGYMRFSPDGHFVFTAFAAAFLLKLLRPDFSKIVKHSHKDQISTLVRKLIRFLGSSEVAVDDRHTPKLYSRFLAELMTRLFSPKQRMVESASLKGHAKQSGQSNIVETEKTAAGEERELELNDTHAMDIRYTTEQGQDIVSSTGQHSYEAEQLQDTMVNYDDSSISPTTAWSAAWPTTTDQHIPDQYPVDETMSLPALAMEEYILSMQAINNPGWWQNVMMPGFSWPVVNDPMSVDEPVYPDLQQVEESQPQPQPQSEEQNYTVMQYPAEATTDFVNPLSYPQTFTTRASFH